MRTREGRIKSWTWHMVDKKYCIVEIVERQVRKNVTSTSWGGGEVSGGQLQNSYPPSPPAPHPCDCCWDAAIFDLLSFFLSFYFTASKPRINFFSYTITLKRVKKQYTRRQIKRSAFATTLLAKRLQMVNIQEGHQCNRQVGIGSGVRGAIEGWNKATQAYSMRVYCRC